MHTKLCLSDSAARLVAAGDVTKATARHECMFRLQPKSQQPSAMDPQGKAPHSCDDDELLEGMAALTAKTDLQVAFRTPDHLR